MSVVIVWLDFENSLMSFGKFLSTFIFFIWIRNIFLHIKTRNSESSIIQEKKKPHVVLIQQTTRFHYTIPTSKILESI